MVNQIVLVGRLAENPSIKEIEPGVSLGSIVLAIPRSFKNKDGIYDTDLISCVISGNIATNITEYCKKGDIIGVKGRTEGKKTKKGYEMQIIAEKVTFLSNSAKTEAE